MITFENECNISKNLFICIFMILNSCSLWGVCPYIYIYAHTEIKKFLCVQIVFTMSVFLKDSRCL